MKRINPGLIALAYAALAAPVPFPNVAVGPARDKLIADAQYLVRTFGQGLNAKVHPAELERRARNKRRARQTHPGKRGKS